MTSVEWFPLVSVTRGPLVENQHFGIAVVADANGRIVRSLGNANRLVFARSALKPMQALPSVESGAAGHFGFGLAELALMCGSHSGEPKHIDGVKAMLERLGLDESALKCGTQIPLYYKDHFAEGVPPLSAFSALGHNCSGKHAGFLAHASHEGASIDKYLDTDHPTQQAVRQAILRTTAVSPELLVEALDGCSAPTYALPLVSLAAAYARFATAAPETELGTLREAMITFPYLVAGSDRTDEVLMRSAQGRVLAKIGADGIQAVGLPSLGLGVAVKIADGNSRAAIAVTLAILQELDVLTGGEIDQVQRVAALTVSTTRGTPVGEYRATLGPL